MGSCKVPTQTSENLNCVLSPSQPSEPPDIGKWFPSYVYDSPLLDTCDGFNGEISTCKQDDLTELDKSQSPNKELDSRHFSLLSEPPDIRNWFSSYEYESPAVEFGDSDSETKEIDKCIQNSRKEHCAEMLQSDELRENISSKVTDSSTLTTMVKRSNLKHEAPYNKKKQIYHEEATPFVFNGSQTPSNNHKSYENFTCKKDKLATELDVVLSAKGGWKSSEVVLKKPTLELKGDENGFVTTGNRGTNKLNSEKRVILEDNQCVVRPVNKDLKRKVLDDTTNVQHSGVKGITGKWLCPQKNKPDKGPPLKQLRLNQWLTRM